MVTEELCDGLDVWSLTTAGTSSRELEERLGKLSVLDVASLRLYIILVTDV